MQQVKNNMVELLPGVWAVEVPEDAWDFDFKESEIQERFILTYKTKFRWKKYGHENWKWDSEFEDKPEILFTTKEFDDSQAATVVDVKEANGCPIGFKDYECEDGSESYREAVHSLESLLRSHGLAPDKNYLLIRKTN